MKSRGNRLSGATAFFVLGLTLLADTCQAEAYSKVSTIKNMTVGLGMARVELTDNTGSFEACSSDRTWYLLDLSSAAAGTKEMLATLLSAKAAGQKVFLQTIGCVGSYSRLTHIYLCDAAC